MLAGEVVGGRRVGGLGRVQAERGGHHPVNHSGGVGQGGGRGLGLGVELLLGLVVGVVEGGVVVVVDHVVVFADVAGGGVVRGCDAGRNKE